MACGRRDEHSLLHAHPIPHEVCEETLVDGLRLGIDFQGENVKTSVVDPLHPFPCPDVVVGPILI
jgi:hypothetical protein